MIILGNWLYLRHLNLKNSIEKRCKICLKFGWHRIFFPYFGFCWTKPNFWKLSSVQLKRKPNSGQHSVFGRILGICLYPTQNPYQLHVEIFELCGAELCCIACIYGLSWAPLAPNQYCWYGHMSQDKLYMDKYPHDTWHLLKFLVVGSCGSSVGGSHFRVKPNF